MNNKENSYKALLLDLDGTLLDLQIDQFIAAYIEALAKKFNGYIKQEDFARHLFGATRVMVANEDPTKINEIVFYEEFCRRTNQYYDLIKPIIDDFYRRDFAHLSCWGRKHPYSRPVVEAAKSKNLALILATNPIFPAAPIQQRLAWSGLDEKDFQLITTMENMHFCKPKKEYYLEIARKTGFAPEQCLMAGNDTVEDLSASKAEMVTFLVEDFILQRGEEEPVCDYRGSLQDLAGFIEQLS